MSMEFSGSQPKKETIKELQSKNNQQAIEVSKVDEKDDLELSDEQLEEVAGGPLGFGVSDPRFP